MRLMTTLHDLMARSPVLLPAVQRDGGLEGLVLDGPIVVNPTPIPFPHYDWYGTQYGDVHIGTDASERLNGGAGNDTIDGGGGADIIEGSLGDDTLRGGTGADRLYGDDGTDTLMGESGNDTLYGGAGNDTMDGGSMADTLWGGIGRDTMRGGIGNDTLHGEAGDDWIYGNEGADVLVGGLGADILYGGAGADRFVLARIDESNTLHDEIRDFERGVDKIDLSAIDADTWSYASTNDAFWYIGNVPLSGNGWHGGELMSGVLDGKTIVRGDVDADGEADITIIVNGTAPLTANDFIL